MTIPTITALPTAPARSDGEVLFTSRADDFVAALGPLVTEINAAMAAIPAEVSGVSYSGTSVTSLTVGTGSKSLTIETGKLWQTGQSVRIANTPTPANYMDGQVTSYNGGTGALVVEVDAVGGSGTFTAWTVSLSASGAATFLGGTLTSLITTATPATGQESLVIPHGAAPTTPTNGSFWTTTAGVFARINGTTYQLSAISQTETLTGKTLTDPAIVGCVLEDIYGIADGAAFEIDPGNGSIQTITLGASRTPKATNFANGESVTLLVDDGTAYSLTWTDGTFGGSGVVWSGGAAPTLATSGYTWIVLTKIGGQVYGFNAGATA